MITAPEDPAFTHSFSGSGLSEALVKTAIAHGYYSLRELMDIPVTVLAEQKWLTPDMLMELLTAFRASGSMPPSESR
jgi:hypothetical protein